MELEGRKTTPLIWKYSESCGMNTFVLNELSSDPILLKLFFLVFDENFWNIPNSYTNKSLHTSNNE